MDDDVRDPLRLLSGIDFLSIEPAHTDEVLRRVVERYERQVRLFDGVASTTPDFVYLFDLQGQFIYANRRLLEVWGMEIQSVIGKTCRQLGYEQWHHDMHMREIDQVIETKCPIKGEVPFKAPLTGVFGVYEYIFTPVLGPDGRVEFIAGTTRDVTERKQTEEALRKSEERLKSLASELEQKVEERTAEVMRSHERLRALATELNIAEQRERKRIAVELHDHLAQMLVLAKLKLAQGKRPTVSSSEAIKEVEDVLAEALNYTRTLIAELCPPVLRDQGLTAGLKWLGDYMKKHGLAVTVTVPDLWGLALPEDQVVLLFQSARELLINTVKHADTTTAAIQVVVENGFLRIDVRDEGKGFDVSLRETQEEHAKFGLLSISERMKALGGSFIVKSAPGEGTTAALVLPLEGSIAANAPQWTYPIPPSPKTAQCVQHPSSRLRVLLVDDHAMIRQGLKSVLDGYDDLEVVGEAGDGHVALELAERLRPTVVVMDINMPHLNGIEATRAIKNRHPEIIIVGLSVSSGGENQEAMKAAGASVLVTKEAAAEQLYAAIRNSVHH